MVLSTPEAIPSSSRSTADRAAFAVGAKKSDIPTPAIRKGGTADSGEPPQGNGRQRRAGNNEPPAADVIGEESGEWADHQQHCRPWQGSNARLQRRIALHELEELSQQED
jgi:hypothetical protein